MKKAIITDEQLDALIARDRAAQGLPPTIEDESVFREIATLLDASTEEPQRADVPARRSA
jgi:hypothetical protein